MIRRMDNVLIVVEDLDAAKAFFAELGEEADALVDAMSVKFTGDPFPMRDNTVYLIAVDSSRFAELPFTDTPG